MNPQPAEFLPWDSDFFGIRIGRVHPGPFDPLAVDAWRRENHIRCLYYLAELDDLASIHAAEDMGFHLLDIRASFSLALPHHAPVNPKFQIRRANDEDLPVIRKLSTGIFTNTRFAQDANFARDRVHDMYNQWVEDHFHLPNTGLWVSEDEGNLTGFVTAVELDATRVRISLLGVSEHARGQGLALSLNNHVINHYSSIGYQHLEAITQTRNRTTFNLNFRCGMKLISQQLWYHGWFEDPQEER